MSHQRRSPISRKPRNFIANDPDEQAQITEFIDNIKQYQDNEQKYIQAEFERVERILSSDTTPNIRENNLRETRSLPGDRPERHHPVSVKRTRFRQDYGNGGVVVQNHYRYVKWILWFLLVVFLGVTTKLYVGQFADSVGSVLEYVRSKMKN